MALRVAAGGLRTPVTVERLSLTRGSMGEVVEDWAVVGTFRAALFRFAAKNFSKTESTQLHALLGCSLNTRQS